MDKVTKEIENLLQRISAVAEKNSELFKRIPYPSEYFTRRGLRFYHYIAQQNNAENHVLRLRLLKKQIDETLAKYKKTNRNRR